MPGTVTEIHTLRVILVDIVPDLDVPESRTHAQWRPERYSQSRAILSASVRLAPVGTRADPTFADR